MLCLWHFESIMWAAPLAGHNLNCTNHKPLVNSVGRQDIQFLSA